MDPRGVTQLDRKLVLPVTAAASSSPMTCNTSSLVTVFFARCARYALVCVTMAQSSSSGNNRLKQSTGLSAPKRRRDLNPLAVGVRVSPKRSPATPHVTLSTTTSSVGGGVTREVDRVGRFAEDDEGERAVERGVVAVVVVVVVCVVCVVGVVGVVRVVRVVVVVVAVGVVASDLTLFPRGLARTAEEGGAEW